MVNRCVCCGEIIPEGRLVCPSCVAKIGKKKTGLLWDYCEGCGKRIEVGEVCYDVADGRTYCLDCVKINKCAGAEEESTWR